MIYPENFDNLWEHLLSNPWSCLDKERLPTTKKLFYNNLKNYEHDQVWEAFEYFIHKSNSNYLPTIQSVLANIEATVEHENYKSCTPPASIPESQFLKRKAFLKEAGRLIFKDKNKVKLHELVEKFREG